MNGIFGAGPADLDYEAELEDSARQWEPTFSESAVARQWDLPLPTMQHAPPAENQMVVRSAPVAPPKPVPAPEFKPTFSLPVATRPATMASGRLIDVGLTIPRWIPWTLALAAAGALVYVIAKKPALATPPKNETSTT